MLDNKRRFQKDDYSQIFDIENELKAFNWNISHPFNAARNAIEKAADLLCEQFSEIAQRRQISLPIYLRNLIATAPEESLCVWTAFLHYAVSSHNPGYAELKKAADFLSFDKRNCGFVFQIMVGKDLPSFESAVLFYEDAPEKGLTAGLKVLKARRSLDRDTIVENIRKIFKLNRDILSAKILADAWSRHGLDKLYFTTFMRLPAVMRQEILSNRLYAVSILSPSAIKHLRTRPKVCRQSPLFAFLHLKKKSTSLKAAIAEQDWSYPGLIPLLTIFHNRKIIKVVLDACRSKGYGKMDLNDIQAITDDRLKRAFLFANKDNSAKQKYFIKLSINEQIDLLCDIPNSYWSDMIASIQNFSQFQSTFKSIAHTGHLKKILRYHLLDSHERSIHQDRILFLKAAQLGVTDLIYEAIANSRYGNVFAKIEPRLFKAIISSAENDKRLADLIQVYQDSVIQAWLKISPGAAINRFKEMMEKDEDVVPLNVKKKILIETADKFPDKIKVILQSPPDMGLYIFILGCIGIGKDELFRNLVDWKNEDGRFVWEQVLEQLNEKDLPHRLVDLIATGRKQILKRGFELCPNLFYQQAVKHLPLKQLLPDALRHPLIGLYVERIHPRSHLVKEIKWVRKIFHDQPTVATAYETALALSLPDASYLLHLATIRWKTRKETLPGHAFNHLYKTYALPKKSGGQRIITVPDPKLKRLQRSILKNGLSQIAVHQAAHGFLKKRSAATNAGCHTGRKLVVNLDITGFFPNTAYRHIVRACKKLCEGRLSMGAVMFVADICSYNGGLPTGAPTSPHIGNIVLHPVDKAIETVSGRNGVSYTRYADDLTFSGDDNAKSIIPFVRKVLRAKGYKLDAKKTNLFRKGRR